jgi:hypothetical protein
METDEWQFPQLEVATVSPAPASPGIDPWLAQPNGWNWHWAAFLGELGIFLLMPACAGYLRAARPFSERIDDWFRHESVGVSRASAAALRRALAERTLPAWVETETTATQPANMRRRVTVWYCPPRTAKQTNEPSVYLSIGFGRPRLLEPHEASLMLSILPRLAAKAEAGAQKYPSASAHSESESQPLAQLLRIPGPHVARAKDEGVRFRAEVLSYVMLFVPIAVILAWGLGLLVAQEWPKLLFAAYVFGLGGGLYVAFNWSMQEGNDLGLRARRWYYRSVITWQASLRPDALFPPDDPNIIDATMIPRRVWANPPAQRQVNEGGLLLIDNENGVLLFEGDSYRYIVPAGSLVHWDVEEIPSQGPSPSWHAVVLVVNTTAGIQELPMIPSSRIEGRTRLDKALALQSRVDALARHTDGAR